MRELKPEEIKNKPWWAKYYYVNTKNKVSYDPHKCVGYELIKEFDINEYNPEEFELFTIDCSGDVTLWLKGRQLKDITRQDSIALAKHFKLTAEDLL